MSSRSHSEPIVPSPSGGRNVGEDRPTLPQDTIRGMSEARKKLAAAREKIETAEAEAAKDKALKQRLKRMSVSPPTSQEEIKEEQAERSQSHVPPDPRSAPEHPESRTGQGRATPGYEETAKAAPPAYSQLTAMSPEERAAEEERILQENARTAKAADAQDIIAQMQQQLFELEEENAKLRTAQAFASEVQQQPLRYESWDRNALAGGWGLQTEHVRMSPEGKSGQTPSPWAGAGTDWEAPADPTARRSKDPEQDAPKEPDQDEELRKLANILKPPTQTMRLGNVVPTIPKIEQPAPQLTTKLVQLADFLREVRRYVNGTLLHPESDKVAQSFFDESLRVHQTYERLGDEEQDTFSLAEAVQPPVCGDKESIKFYKLFASLLFPKLPDAVKDEDRTIGISGQGWTDCIGIFLCIRRVYDIRDPIHVGILEAVARRPRGSTYKDLRDWDTIASVAIQIGHVSPQQVALGLVSLVDHWERAGVLEPREQRELTNLESFRRLNKFGVTSEQVAQVTNRMLRLVQRTKAKPKLKPSKAFGASTDLESLEEEFLRAEHPEDETPPEQPTDAGAEAALIAKGKGGKSDGKGGKGQDGGCFNCGAKDHWSRECPKPRGGATAQAGQAGAENDRTAEGTCWRCGSAAHHKKQCPVWIKEDKARQQALAAQPKAKPKKKAVRKARLVQVLAALFDSDDEQGSPGNEAVPPPPQ